MNRFLKGSAIAPKVERHDEVVQDRAPLEDVSQANTTWAQRTPVIACGAGLFADGYLNGVIGSVGTMLGKIYGTRYTDSSAVSNISALVFVGEVVGIGIFGYTSDHWSRKWSLFISTIILFIFAALGAGAYGAHGTFGGLVAALSAYRFLLGIGIGGEYPAGSVGCAECTGELKAGVRNRWFIWFTNLMIDFGFVVAAIVPMIVVLITGEDHLRAAWRICLGLGVIPPLSLIYMRFKLKEPAAFQRESMAHTKTPWLLVVKFYWWRLSIVSVIWFIYDFSAFAFGIYGSRIVLTIIGDTAPLWQSFGWNTLINFLYIPGAFAGSFVSDWIGPRKALAYGVAAQAVVGFIMAGVYNYLNTPANIGGFVVVYGIFLSLGELGPGDNIGLVASKTCATPIRGQYYAVASAMGKIGAFVGTYLFPIIEADAPTKAQSGQYAFYVSSSLCVLSAFIAFFLLPEIGQDTIDYEDLRFRAYLEQNGYDTSAMGITKDAAAMGESGSGSGVQEVSHSGFEKH